VERRLGAATRGYVLIGEGVSGDVGELRELQGGEREVRKGSMGGKKGSKGGAHKKGADGGGARTKSDVEKGSPVAGASVANVWAVEKWARSLSSGTAKRRTGKGGWTVASVHVE
jgi:hypothetical protein